MQLIAAIAPVVDELVVFQRRPNWCAPLHNAPITDDEMASIKARYDEIFEQCSKTAGGFIHGMDPRLTTEVPEEERYAFYDELYAAPGFRIWLGNFRDVLMDETANAEFTEYMADKIRSRVHDPAVAEKLIPKDHGFGSRRVPMETRYYEAYNLPHVHLVDINDTPIECVTETGIRTSERDYDVDLIVYATGFDAVTGAFDRIEFIGVDGVTLKEKWAHEPVSHFGLMTHGFPNLFMLAGPQSGSGNTNFGRGVEDAVFWMSDLLAYLRDHGTTRMENTVEAEQAWQEHVRAMYDMLLLRNTKSWFTGYNSNVPGHEADVARCDGSARVPVVDDGPGDGVRRRLLVDVLPGDVPVREGRVAPGERDGDGLRAGHDAPGGHDRPDRVGTAEQAGERVGAVHERERARLVEIGRAHV